MVQVIPVLRTVPLPEADPFTLFSALHVGKGYILESMEGVPRRAVRSIVGLEPEGIIALGDQPGFSGKSNVAGLLSPVGGPDPISQLRELSSRIHFRNAGVDEFSGGLVGYCTYDMVTSLTGGHVQAGREESPLARFMLSTRGVVYDHVRRSCLLFDDVILPAGCDPAEGIKGAQQRLDDLATTIRDIRPMEEALGPAPSEDAVPGPGVEDRQRYQDAVVRAKEHIMAGDIFQVVLSRKVTCPYPGDPLGIYRHIRAFNPSPYLYYLQFGDEAIVGSSPEMLVKVQGDRVQTVPIAGTRPRGKDPGEDIRLEKELRGDEKERAEHLMLVDLARNDIGRVSRFGSVSVPEFMEVEKFSHVQHIVSRVCGRIADGKDRFDALASCFPAGTVSGAPKIRAMQIIAEIEPSPRGLYAGAVGYSGFGELLEFAIAIRTLRVRGGQAEFSTGAGIVADSVPEKEFEETGHKAQAMIRAVIGDGE